MVELGREYVMGNCPECNKPLSFIKLENGKLLIPEHSLPNGKRCESSDNIINPPAEI